MFVMKVSFIYYKTKSNNNNNNNIAMYDLYAERS